jgi:hypothetical protein
MVLSGYLAMQIAWVMGADRIVLCGCPGTQTKRFFEASLGREHANTNFGYGGGSGSGDEGVRQQVEREMRRLPDFKAAVRSLSGWTKTYFTGDLSWPISPRSQQPKCDLQQSLQTIPG